MEDIESIKEKFEGRGYIFYQNTPVTPIQFQKIFVYDNGIKYCLTWYFQTKRHAIFGDKTTYYCMIITGSRIKIEINQEILNIEDIENKAKQLYLFHLLEPFQDFNKLR